MSDVGSVLPLSGLARPGALQLGRCCDEAKAKGPSCGPFSRRSGCCYPPFLFSSPLTHTSPDLLLHVCALNTHICTRASIRSAKEEGCRGHKKAQEWTGWGLSTGLLPRWSGRPGTLSLGSAQASHAQASPPAMAPILERDQGRKDSVRTSCHSKAMPETNP